MMRRLTTAMAGRRMRKMRMYKVKAKITDQELNWLTAMLNNEFMDRDKASSILKKMKVKEIEKGEDRKSVV